jgi:hypothetical protein
MALYPKMPRSHYSNVLMNNELSLDLAAAVLVSYLCLPPGVAGKCVFHAEFVLSIKNQPFAPPQILLQA